MGTLGVMLDYTLNGTQCTMHTHIYIANPPTDMLLEGARKPENSEETHVDMGRT